TPAVYLDWFQALEACKNSGKRLPSNAEWQMAVTGTPDTGGGRPDCNTVNGARDDTGLRSNCKSSVGAFDMGGNVDEWVAEWMPASSACPGWGAFSDNTMCLSGVDTSQKGPGALVRGGAYSDEAAAGPLAAFSALPSTSTFFIGFRCAR